MSSFKKNKVGVKSEIQSLSKKQVSPENKEFYCSCSLSFYELFCLWFLCFCRAGDQHYQWLTWVQISDTTWITELATESIVLLTSTLTQHLLDLGAEEFREWMKLVISVL